MTYWNDKQTDILRKLWPTKSASEICAALDHQFTRNAIIGRANRLSLPRKSSKALHDIASRAASNRCTARAA